MTRAERYFERAGECERLAETMSDQEAMFRFLEAASAWRKLAEQFDGLTRPVTGAEIN